MLAAGAALLLAGGAGAARRAPGRFGDALAAIEARSGGRLGVALVDGRGKPLGGHREDERFPLCSTFKALAAAAVLHRVDQGKERLDRVVRFTRTDIVANSPVTGAHADGSGLPLATLCEAAITLSDNSAGNLLLDAIAGPAGLTAFARTLGDRFTRLDRRETALNSAIPDDPRDTTTPAAMALDYVRLASGPMLSSASRAQWLTWLAANRTGGTRLRAGLPAGWRIADKTGTGENGTSNHVALLWPPGGGMMAVAVYLTGSPLDMAGRDAALADVARAIVASE